VRLRILPIVRHRHAEGLLLGFFVRATDPVAGAQQPF
jgi:hypothetical protein